MAILAKLVVDLQTNTAKFSKGMNDANRKLDRFGRSVKNTRNLVVGMLAAVGVGKAVQGINKLSKSIDGLAKTSDKLGLTTEALAGLRHAAELSGVGANTLDMALQRMTRRIAEAKKGTGEAKDALRELGLDAKTLAQLAPDVAFSKIAKAMENVTNQGDKVRLAMRLFDSEGVALVNTLALGTEGLQKANDEAKAFGTALSRIDAAKVEEANDAMTRVKAAIEGAGNRISVALSPYIAEIGNQFADAAARSDGFKNAIDNSLVYIAKGIGFVADTFRGLHIVWEGLKVAFIGLTSHILNGLDGLNKGVAELINIIPGINITPSPALSKWASDAEQSFINAQVKMMELVMTPMPSDNVEAWFEKVRAAAQKTAEEIAASKKNLDKKDVGDKKTTSQWGSQQQALLDQTGSLDTELMTQQERLNESLESRRFMIEDAFQNEVITWERRSELIEKIEKDHQQKVSTLQRNARDNSLGIASDLFGGLASIAQAGGEKSFRTWKRLAAAQTLISTYSAAQKAYESQIIPGDPTSVGRAVLAASAAVFSGLGRLRQINATSLSSTSGGAGASGGGGTSGGGAFPQPSPLHAQQSQGGQRTVQLFFQGGINGVDDIKRAVADALKGAENADIITFTGSDGQRINIA